MIGLDKIIDVAPNPVIGFFISDHDKDVFILEGHIGSRRQDQFITAFDGDDSPSGILPKIDFTNGFADDVGFFGNFPEFVTSPFKKLRFLLRCNES